MEIGNLIFNLGIHFTTTEATINKAQSTVYLKKQYISFGHDRDAEKPPVSKDELANREVRSFLIKLKTEHPSKPITAMIYMKRFRKDT